MCETRSTVIIIILTESALMIVVTRIMSMVNMIMCVMTVTIIMVLSYIHVESVITGGVSL